MEILEALETYLFETGQIHALAKRQARLLCESVKNKKLVDEARMALLLTLASLSRGAPRTPADFLLSPLAHDAVRPFIDAYVKEHADARPAWESIISGPALFKKAAEMVGALFENPQRLAPLTGVEPPENTGPHTTSRYPLLVINSNKDRMGFSRYYCAAASLEKALSTRLRQQWPAAIPDDRAVEIITAVFVNTSILGKDQKFHYRQVAAAALALTTPFMIVSGGPGTGKTRVVIQILRLLLRAFPEIAPDRISLCAPTGRAKARLGESIDDDITNLEKTAPGEGPAEQAREAALKNLPRQTIDGLLGIRPDGTMKYDAQNPLPCQVIVVDEASMVDLYRFNALLDAAAPDCRILLVGDMHQLPSVDAGAVLGDLTYPFNTMPLRPTLSKKTAAWVEHIIAPVATDGNDRTEKSSLILPDNKPAAGPLADHAVILSHSYRSTKEILLLGEAVNMGDHAAVQKIIAENSASGAISHLTAEGTKHIETWLKKHFPHEKLAPLLSLRGLDPEALYDPAHPDNGATVTAFEGAFSVLDNSRILTLANEGPRGRKGINALADTMLRPLLDPQSTHRFSHGMPIVLGSNHHDLDLFNGDIGMAVRQAGGDYKAVFRRGRNIFVHALDRLADCEPAFAMTVHKSQGSEFDDVLLVLPEHENPLLSRQIVYTGITRAKSKIMILGSAAILAKAITTYEKRVGGIELG
jgi:exodeoxyribonuclease V alpha subunit